MTQTASRREALRGSAIGIVGLIGAASVSSATPTDTDDEFVRLCQRLVAIEEEELHVHSQRHSIEEEDRTEAALHRLSDQRADVMSRLKALDLPHTSRGVRALADAALAAWAPGEDDNLEVYDYVEWLTASLVLAVAGAGASA